VICRWVSKENLAQHVEGWRIAVDKGADAGMVCPEPKGEQARDLPRGGVLRRKGANITLPAAYRFRFQTEKSAAYSESA
jgi:hypothetical protein